MIDMAVAAFLSQADIFAFREAQTTPLKGFVCFFAPSVTRRFGFFFDFFFTKYTDY